MTPRRDFGRLVVSLTVLLLLPQAAAAQDVVEVFRLSHQSVACTAGATVYVVDGLHRFTERLSAALPTTAAQAQPVARERLEALTAPDKAALRHAATGLVRATEYRIAKVPAIVFDGKAIVYGVADVDQARAIYRGWRARSGAS